MPELQAARRARTEESHAAAVEQGMLDLKHSAALLLSAGLVSVEDVMNGVSVED